MSERLIAPALAEGVHHAQAVALAQGLERAGPQVTHGATLSDREQVCQGLVQTSRKFGVVNGRAPDELADRRSNGARRGTAPL